ncbi:hypothetical protein BKA67DRAFT_559779 [Truncatella angustata]|uniref:F-box domain-containing protein n=1 Tax=Truncatella angustata TaxID=152316 RepID=A0A9P8UN76_9PEZI|nr:uncharacterized protein BKA67DRAFT_559779 [Truncatella angustata]KAH6655197.1 hypothetical protein BKA67DRAFT_559779 [Truncatella angustata]KAH8204736.1 hypothetical protein TruAng_001070 [Truncatella angustata]
MAPSISTLPPELLIRICDFMQSKRDIANFFRSSRQFYAVASPHLYRHVDLLSLPRFIFGYQTRDVAQDIDALIAAVVRDPHLAGLVKHLNVRLTDIRHDRSQNGRSLSPEQQELVKALLPDIPGSQARRFSGTPPPCHVNDDGSGSEWESADDSADEDELEAYDPDKAIPVFETEADRWIWLAQRSAAIRRNVILTILLSRLPNLERLDLEMPALGWRTGFLDRVIQRSKTGNPESPDSSPFLANLRRMCFGYTAPDQRGECWIGAFVHPKLDSVYLHRLSGLGPSLSYLAPRMLNITHLELRDCRIAPPSLLRLLSSPKALKTFIYVVGEVQTRAEHYMPISYKSIRAALEKQKDSLEKIWLDYPHDYQWDEASNQHTSPMSSFSTFNKLKYLRIAGTYIFGFVWTNEVDEGRLLRALPEQLETLHMTHADEDEETLEGISFVLDAKKRGRLQQLTELKFEAASTWYMGNRRELVRLFDLAKSVGLSITLLDNHSDRRIEHPWQRRQAALNFTQSAAYPRRESGWGFFGETTWPRRVSGCMQIPIYDDISDMWTGARQSS